MSIRKNIGDLCQDKSVIVVGNSADMIASKKGEKIDHFDVVVRLNWALPKKEWIDSLGAKTTIWVCAFNSLSGQISLFREFKPPYCIRLNNKVVHPELRDIFQYWDFENWYQVKHETGISKFPSTALVTIYFFLQFLHLKEICVTGFDFFSTPTFYHDKNVADKWHEPVREREYIMNWADRGRIHFL